MIEVTGEHIEVSNAIAVRLRLIEDTTTIHMVRAYTPPGMGVHSSKGKNIVTRRYRKGTFAFLIFFGVLISLRVK